MGLVLLKDVRVPGIRELVLLAASLVSDIWVPGVGFTL